MATSLKGSTLKKIVYLAAAIFLATVFLAACGGDPEATATPEPPPPTSTADPTATPTATSTAEPTATPTATSTAEPTATPTATSTAEPTATPTATSTAEPTATPTATSTAEPTATPTATSTAEPTATPTAVPTSVPDPAASISPDAEVSDEGALSVECPLDGTLDSAVAISSCSALAVQQVNSFSFNAEIDLLALFPVEETGGDEGSIQLSGSMVQPGRLRFQINMGLDAEMIEINGVIVGNDTYVQDPESRLWFKGAPPDADFLASLQMVGMLMLPTDPAISLNGTIDLDDGSMAYLIVSDQPAQQGSGAGFPLGSDNAVTRVVGVADFLPREVRVAAEGLDGETRDFITISYHGYNEAAEIEPPADYLPLPDEAMDPGTPGSPMVMGLTRNDDGDVEVMFSEPVFVEGDVELYVLDPETGGWGLPLLGGSGTDTLTFDADAEDRPSLVLGESQIAGFSFHDSDSNLVDSEGTWVNLNFDFWTYE